jgi:hypothetical protein
MRYSILVAALLIFAGAAGAQSKAASLCYTFHTVSRWSEDACGLSLKLFLIG